MPGQGSVFGSLSTTAAKSHLFVKPESRKRLYLLILLCFHSFSLPTVQGHTLPQACQFWKKRYV